MTGNTFGEKTISFNPAKKVWRCVRHVYPGGAMLDTASLVAYKNKIVPAGTPVKYDSSAKTVKVYSDTDITTAVAPVYTQVTTPAVADIANYYEKSGNVYSKTSDTTVGASKTYYTMSAGAGVAALGINGYTKDDINVADNVTAATCTVVYAGEIYGYMLDEAVAATLKTNTLTPQVVFVY